MAQDMWGMKRWFFKRLRKQALRTMKLLRSAFKGKKLYSPLSFMDYVIFKIMSAFDTIVLDCERAAQHSNYHIEASHKTRKRLLLGEQGTKLGPKKTQEPEVDLQSSGSLVQSDLQSRLAGFQKNLR
ncbi:hypothetical protein GmHk_17G050069 [Glycine max]|nr:hypothetical protein GmHk_17G050069 [Glycine max]